MFPTGVGMNRELSGQNTSLSDVPHMRGDDLLAPTSGLKKGIHKNKDFTRKIDFSFKFKALER
jgi:hypothetical protein